VGWPTLYEILLLLLALAIFGLFGLWEREFAKQPIMPLDIWTAPPFLSLIFVVLFTIMSYGIALWYLVAWQQIIRRWTVLQFSTGLVRTPSSEVWQLPSPLGLYRGLLHNGS